ncbi:Small-conductance mechanosensitive channel [Methanolobus vulcani]|jgi:small-conductance mechanosensitive channel|uniref:Small-conductance mechanosensitive channel n=1 Tax=Methanolobus vulcani TaxID=38026 RepID=A0A7Z7AXN0_9EURY|nr:mechanosensitive ion channel domain-containing protein [Methanolobus vulcani]SDF25676.1 Small-conductance mechanosensitive channel [Methanolobus vulcani]
MAVLQNFLDNVNLWVSAGINVLIVLFFLLFINVFFTIIRTNLMKKAKTKKQRSNIRIFGQLSRYTLSLLVIILAILSSSGAWSSFGVFLGLLSAAIGFALQQPITGVAAWIMVVTKRPFDIGDRIIIGDVKGDVVDFNLTHVHVMEIGGLITDEENSGRIIMVPNWMLFEKNIINYTYNNDFVLHSVIVNVTYESNLDRAIEIADLSARKFLAGTISTSPGVPKVRVDFQASGIDVQVKYFSPARQLHEYSSKITKEIFDRINDAEDVEIAYPHTEVIFRKKAM